MSTTATATADAIETTAARYDIFTPIHKGLRRALFETALELARTDFAAPEEAAAAARASARCFGFLREHAEHEDRHVIPQLLAVAPGLGEALASEHPRLERKMIEIDELWARLGGASAPERATLGRELGRRFQSFVAQQVEHMDREEREVNAAFWARLEDADLAALSGRVAASIDGARMAEWLELLLPALSRPEREAMAARAA